MIRASIGCGKICLFKYILKRNAYKLLYRNGNGADYFYSGCTWDLKVQLYPACVPAIYLLNLDRLRQRDYKHLLRIPVSQQYRQQYCLHFYRVNFLAVVF